MYRPLPDLATYRTVPIKREEPAFAHAEKNEWEMKHRQQDVYCTCRKRGFRLRRKWTGQRWKNCFPETDETQLRGSLCIEKD